MTNGNDAPNPPDEIVRLVEQFDAERAAYRSGKYNETQVRIEFIDPFFTTLGWDVENRSGARPSQREVVHEYTLRTTYGTKAPDYCFYTGGERRFFVEAKKPSVDLKHDPTPAFQVRRYGWSAGLDLSILTDFEELVVYNCRAEPSAADPSSVGQLLYLDYTQYLDQWPRISSLFSKQAVLAGSLTDFIGTVKATKGATVDAAFLKEISGWRDALAIDIALRNPALNQRDLNYAVQMTIDRILFLRICEARGIDTRNRLEELRDTHSGIYSQLGKLFRDADDRYNSGLFHFNRQGDRDDADTFTLDLSLGDAPLHNILRRIYPPYSPYAFDVLPVEILGQVYEQFLGKVITLSSTGSVTVEEKPEVRKAGGVYYTPTYIVDYIVKNTVGKLLDGKTPRQADALRILDPACGSGSFLIGAYNYLLQWHLDEYIKAGLDKRDIKPRVETGQDGTPRLTINERKRILLNNIFGVDIDTQAVEVTKLSLLLKVLEGETERSLATQLTMFHERALPDLSSNIKCGNSLIASDFYQDKQSAFVDMEEARRINAFDWDGPNGFPQIMQAGGFDAVIGNPPYIRIQAMKEWAPIEVELYKQRYKAASKGNYDIYVVFVEKGLSLLNEHGRLGFILPHKFFNAQYGEPLRGLIAGGKHLSHVVHFGDQQVFKGATTYTCLMFLNKESIEVTDVLKIDDIRHWYTEGAAQQGNISSKSSEWIVTVGGEGAILEKLGRVPTKLLDVAARIFQGIIPGADEVYALRLLDSDDSKALCYSRALKSEIALEAPLLRAMASGADVKRYLLNASSTRVIYPYKFANGQCLLIPAEELSKKYPLTYQYFLDTRQLLDKRDRGSARGPDWYRYIRTQNIALQPTPKLAVPRLVNRLHAGFDSEGAVCLDNVDVGGIILNNDSQASYMYILGLLNSKLLDFFFVKNTVPFRGGYYSANRQYIEGLPIRTIDPTNPADKKQHDAIVSLVEQMLSLHKQLAEARNPQDKTFLQTRIDATDHQIDRLVYDLYNLTPEEIKIVEAGTK